MQKKVLILISALLLLVVTGSTFAQNTGASTDRKVLSHTSPVYPDLAKKMHIRGTVKVEAVVRPNGTVKSTRVLGGNPVLINAAQDAVTKWKFEAGQSETTQIVQLAFDGN